jgi:hypothetical protein
MEQNIKKETGPALCVSNLLQPAQAEVAWDQLSMYLASCVTTVCVVLVHAMTVVWQQAAVYEVLVHTITVVLQQVVFFCTFDDCNVAISCMYSIVLFYWTCVQYNDPIIGETEP